MIDTALFHTHYTVLLLFGLCLSLALSGVSYSKKNRNIFIGLFLLCGALQIITYKFLGEVQVWLLYPFITHLPTLLVLWKYYKRRFITSVAAVTTAYLCCQPSNIAGVIVFTLTENPSLEYLARTLIFLSTGLVLYKFFTPCIAAVFSRNDRSINTFAFLPLGYYIYDYTLGIYAKFWYTNNPIAKELLPFFLCLGFLFLCATYYQEYALREQIERKDQIIVTTAEQQKKELDSIRRSSQELRLMRHDMRHLLSNVAFCIENNDSKKALEMISAFTSHVDGTVIERYCENETLNYVIAAFAARCENEDIEFIHKAEIDVVSFEEIMLASIISNALDNALNAQLELPEDKRCIKLVIRHNNGKLLISIKNPVLTQPAFVDGLPLSKQKGHGYGTKSIRYVAEKLGGNCQFSVQDGWFTLRIVL